MLLKTYHIPCTYVLVTLFILICSCYTTSLLLICSCYTTSFPVLICYLLSSSLTFDVTVPAGKEAVEGQGKMDASAMYAMIFGSELFESIIGK